MILFIVSKLQTAEFVIKVHHWIVHGLYHHVTTWGLGWKANSYC